MASERVAVGSGVGSVGATALLSDLTVGECAGCAAGGLERSAVARCRFCALALCSEHLDGAFGPKQIASAAGCHHVFVATGWLERALRT